MKAKRVLKCRSCWGIYTVPHEVACELIDSGEWLERVAPHLLPCVQRVAGELSSTVGDAILHILKGQAAVKEEITRDGV